MVLWLPETFLRHAARRHARAAAETSTVLLAAAVGEESAPVVGAEPEWITRLWPRLPPDASSLDDAVAHSAHVKQDRVLISAVGQALVVAGQYVHTGTFGENIRLPLL